MRLEVTFCFSNGATDARVARAVRDAGYTQAATTQWDHSPKSESLWLLKGRDMTSAHSSDRRREPSRARVVWRMSGLYPGLP